MGIQKTLWNVHRTNIELGIKTLHKNFTSNMLFYYYLLELHEAHQKNGSKEIAMRLPKKQLR